MDGEGHIRQAVQSDISRLAEILVFNKRVNYRPIFHNDAYSFGELQVLPVAQRYRDDPALLRRTWVYADGFVKGLLHMEGREVSELYVEHFFQNQGIGAALLRFAVRRLDAQYLWALEKNERALRFYAAHGFLPAGPWQYEEGTTERLLRLERKG